MTDDAEILESALSGNLDALRDALAGRDAHPMELPAAAALGDAGAIARLAFAGRADAVALMLDLGFDGALKTDGFTPLHNAAGNGDVAAVDVLLKHGAPLEVLSDYEGTVLAHAVYNSVYFANPDGDYPAVAERLIEAGASLAPITGPIGNPAVDAVLRKHGAFT